MSPAQERSYLRAMLHRVHHGPSRLFASFWGLTLLWLSLVLASLIALATASLLPAEGVALVFFILGCTWTYIAFRFSAARCWPTHACYLDRHAIEARLDELDSNVPSGPMR